MRIIAGSLKGGGWSRGPGRAGPTSDKLRETLFNILAARLGARVLDGFAGEAVGLEALSRGAAHVTFVERDRRASRSSRAIWRCGVESACAIIRAGSRRGRGRSRGPVRSRPARSAADEGRAIVAAAAPLVGRGPARRSTRAAAAPAAGAVRVRAVRSGDSALAIYQRRTPVPERLAVYPRPSTPHERPRRHHPRRGLFDRIIVSTLVNPEKSPLFTVEERVDIARQVFEPYPNVEVDTFDGLLVDYARRKGAHVIVRGLRAVSDFEYELQMALMNRRLHPDVETVFMMPAEAYTYLSSRLVKEIFALGGSITGLVPEVVESRLHAKQRTG
jgi:pantetheine-phosphate adenylyltransferase